MFLANSNVINNFYSNKVLKLTHKVLNLKQIIMKVNNNKFTKKKIEKNKILIIKEFSAFRVKKMDYFHKLNMKKTDHKKNIKKRIRFYMEILKREKSMQLNKINI